MKSTLVTKAQTFDDLPQEFRECVDNFIFNGNKTRAFELTRTEDELNNKNSVKAQAYTFFNKKNIIKIIEDRKQQLATVGSMKPQEVIRELEDIVKGNAKDQFSDIPAIKDRLSAIEKLLKLQGLLDDRPQNNFTVQQVFVDDIKE